MHYLIAALLVALAISSVGLSIEDEYYKQRPMGQGLLRTFAAILVFIAVLAIFYW